jgi:serine/threonine-protein kinase
MARVYLARELHPNRQVAIKVLEPSVAVSLGRERFLREIDVVSNLTHPHIVPIYAAGEADGLLYFVMPFVDGETLSRRIGREGVLPLGTALRIASEVAGALEYAHRRNIIHRDIKPENILLHDGYALVTDFGVARAISAAGTSQFTETGITLGTPAYMSPEQAAGEIELDGRTDTYALGCVLFEMLTGEPPFGKGSAHTLMGRQVTEPAPRVRSRHASVPVEVEKSVERALAKRPEDRYSSAGAFAEALDLLRSGLTSGSGLRAMRQSAGARWRQAVVGLVVLVAAIAVTWQTASNTTAALPGLATYADSVALMPIENMTGDPSLDLLGDAVTYGAIRRLQRVPTLKSSSYLSVHTLAQDAVSVRAMAESLAVRLILSSQFRRVGAATRLDAELVEAASGRTVRTGSWAVSVSDEESAERELAARLTGLVASGTGLAPTADRGAAEETPAHEAYLLGKQWLGRRTSTGVRRAIGYFGAAIALDSMNARAHEGLSKAYSLALFYRYEMGMTEYAAAGRALHHAEQAVALDPDYAAGYAARGYVTSRTFGPTRESARDFRKALQLEPNASQAIGWSGAILAQQKRSEEAFKATERGADLDPLSPAPHLAVAYGAFAQRRYETVIERAKRAAALQPEIVAARALWGRALLLAGRADECLTLELGPHAGVRAACLAALGQRDDAAAIVDSIGRVVRQGSLADSVYTAVIRAEDLACYYAWIGDTEQALAWLEYAFSLSPIGVDQRVLRSEIFDRLWQRRDLAARVERILDGVWPRVKAAS